MQQLCYMLFTKVHKWHLTSSLHWVNTTLFSIYWLKSHTIPLTLNTFVLILWWWLCQSAVVLAPPLLGKCGFRGLWRGPVTVKILSVICTNAVFNIKPTYISKFSSQVSNYTLIPKISFRGKDLWLGGRGPLILRPLELPLVPMCESCSLPLINHILVECPGTGCKVGPACFVNGPMEDVSAL